jgi:NAD(P)H-dependent flavin oxidoreductase YrpB (nitropropane dioxygenase family)
MQSWREVIGTVLHEAGDVPVLVAGGLANGKALREVLSLGGAGGVLGTRFLASKESPGTQTTNVASRWRRRPIRC